GNIGFGLRNRWKQIFKRNAHLVFLLLYIHISQFIKQSCSHPLSSVKAGLCSSVIVRKRSPECELRCPRNVFHAIIAKRCDPALRLREHGCKSSSSDPDVYIPPDDLQRVCLFFCIVCCLLHVLSKRYLMAGLCPQSVILKPQRYFIDEFTSTWKFRIGQVHISLAFRRHIRLCLRFVKTPVLL